MANKGTYFVFTKHAKDRMSQQHLSEKQAIELLRGSERISGRGRDKDNKVFYLVSGQWKFTVQEVVYDKKRGAIVRVITVTDQRIGPKAWHSLYGAKPWVQTQMETEKSWDRDLIKSY